VVVRGLQSLGTSAESVDALARVAVNLRGVPRGAVRRGDALLTPGTWLTTGTVDVRLSSGSAADLRRQVVLHVGTAAVPTRVRPLGTDTARLSLAQPLPLRIGDRALLRDPGAPGPCSIPAGVTVLDVRPPALRRRGAAAARAADLSTMDGTPDGAAELRRRGLIRRDELVAMGVPEPTGVPQEAGWLVDPPVLAQRATQLTAAVAAYAAGNPLEPGMPLETARQVSGMPDARLVDRLLDAGGLTVSKGRVHLAGSTTGLPDAVRSAIAELRAELAQRPFAAPDVHRLAELGLGAKQLAAAVRAGELLKIADGIYLAPGAEHDAIARLRGLPSPFTLSQARQALDTTRRVAVPIMGHLARRGISRQLPDGTHELR
jgi:selenocysteine-specific elongation factor